MFKARTANMDYCHCYNNEESQKIIGRKKLMTSNKLLTRLIKHRMLISFHPIHNQCTAAIEITPEKVLLYFILFIFYWIKRWKTPSHAPVSFLLSVFMNAAIPIAAVLTVSLTSSLTINSPKCK